MATDQTRSTLDPKKAGMTLSHISAVARQCEVDNIFLFVRPSTDDTRRLIEAGFATKSMDIHDKSSDWGPMAGMVPVDPELSKKPKGAKPNMKPQTKAPHEQALATHLILSQPMLTSMVGRKLRDVRADGYSVFIPTGGSLMPRLVYTPFGAAPTPKDHRRVPIGGFKLYQATRSPTAFGQMLLFVAVKSRLGWRMFWALTAPRQKFDNRLVPVVVWGYHRGGKLTPVTGDYDLWMVVPHMSRSPIELHHGVSIRPDAHGPSAVSGYTALLLRRLNRVCGRTANPVFNHGAEAQNVGFTQDQDNELVMFTPSGRARMVKMNELPRILSDLHKTGYIVTLNKQWSVSGDMALSGKTIAQQQLKLAQTTNKQDQEVLEKDIAKQLKSAQQIKDWYKELLKLLERHDDQKLDALQPTDLPTDFRVASAKARQASYKVQQQLLAKVTNRPGDVNSGAVDAEVWGKWYNENIEMLDWLREYWGLDG